MCEMNPTPMEGPVESIVTRVQKSASKISEIFSSLTDSKESVWTSLSSPNNSVEAGKSKSHSYDAFCKRVSTFHPGLWTVHGLSPLECARWGWKLLEKDALQCVTCHEVICAALPSRKDKISYEKFFGILKDRLEAKHKDACGWLYDPCPQEFVEPLRIDTVEELRNMTNSAHNLAALGSALPHINSNRISAILGTDNEVISELFKNNSTSEDIKTISVLLVLSGWSKGHGAYLFCTVCRRQVGLWSFVSVADEMKTDSRIIECKNNLRKRKFSENSVTDEQENNDNKRVTRQSPKKFKPSSRVEDVETERPRTRSSGKDDRSDDDTDVAVSSLNADMEKNNECLLITSPSTQVEKVEKQYFNPLEEHRHWCPWITIVTNGRPNDEDTDNIDDVDLPKGFCLVAEQVRAMLHVSKQLQSAKTKKLENVEGLRRIRKILDEIYDD
ncbi:hypothetical protein SK128_023246 [Halocaridina rubra]|uniref:Nuclear-interacting partner of ALK n=1 Tax=Halocaridina rubra TaxID=373956 RepID=A0AAN8WYC6_HALRR